MVQWIHTHSHLVAGLFTAFAMQPAPNEFLFISVISYQGYTATALVTNSPKGLVTDAICLYLAHVIMLTQFSTEQRLQGKDH